MFAGLTELAESVIARFVYVGYKTMRHVLEAKRCRRKIKQHAEV